MREPIDVVLLVAPVPTAPSAELSVATLLKTAVRALRTPLLLTFSFGAAETSVVVVESCGGVWSERMVPVLTTFVLPFGNTQSSTTVMPTLPRAPAATVPRVQVTTPPEYTPPAVAETKVARGGIGSLI